MDRGRFSMLVVTLLLLAWTVQPDLLCAHGQAKADDHVPSFKESIQPLLQAKCLRCHGGQSTKAGLDLRTPETIQQGGNSGPVIVPGRPEESLLYQKVSSGKMPPGKKDALRPAEVEALRKWIASGAALNRGQTTESSVAGAASVTQHDVLPILRRHCTACHGRHRQEHGLDLRSKAAMLRGGTSGPVIVPGKPEASLLLQRMRLGQMPPPGRLVEASVKPVEKAEADLFARWIALGAPEVTIQPDVATTTPDPLVSDQDRDFWAFRPPRPVAVPAAPGTAPLRNPIDAFILQKLESKGLSMAPEADRLTLLRRASFDLTGLPPEPAEIKAFLADRSDDSYEKMIDRLLASPRYGEHWGRHWLDLAGYADSEGKREQDLFRPHAWRFRDYVIRSYNADKPYDRFLLEQIAGDELADWEHAPQITPEIYDNLVATGFLRMAPDPTWANITGYLQDRIEVIADEMDVLGSAVLGLTLKCARCHDHKFDPIPQRDYYRLIDIFKGAYDEYDWLKPDIHPGIGPVSQDVVGGRLLPCVQPARDRSQASNTSESKIQALWDRGEPSPTYIYRRGDPLNLGRLVGPGVPSVLTDGKTPFVVQPPWPESQCEKEESPPKVQVASPHFRTGSQAKKTGRRLAFARWLTEARHPLTARVLVNRLWKHHFGTGIVQSLENFGKNGTLPTHPELLDWLAGDFVRRGYSQKAMHRLMMTSATYRQSSAVTPLQQQRDPENRWFSRMPLRRLDAESLYDTLLVVADRLDERRYGPADPVQVQRDGLVTPGGNSRGWRRLIYVQHLRKNVPTHMENFDYPQMNPNCVQRRDSVVALQALELMNSATVHQLAEHFARRLRRQAGQDPARQIELGYLIALGRQPGEEEKQVGLSALAGLTREWAKQRDVSGNPDAEAAGQRALATYCHALLNSAGFLYVD
jgi:cytochrome c553